MGQMNNGSGGDVLLLILAALYMLPTLLASVRLRINTAAIFALNLFAGWTVAGWVVSLVWALSAEDKGAAAKADPATPLNRWNSKQCPMCAERILKAARKCRYCGHMLDELAKGQGVKAIPPSA